MEAHNYHCKISVINTTEKEIEIQTPHVQIEQITKENTAELLATAKEEDSIPKSRTEKIKQLLRTEHLNQEEKRAIERISEEYSDTFHLKGEPLTYTNAVQHEIATRDGSASVNTRPYRLPEKHKEEVNKQVQEMLKAKIIKSSVSQWNAPFLVIPKKTDSSGKSKLRVVVDFRKLNDLTGDLF